MLSGAKDAVPLPPDANKASDNIFTKISKLNEALNAINPRYKPIGFSITSIESCSPSVLQDATLATETAISTLMSVIGKSFFVKNCVLNQRPQGFLPTKVSATLYLKKAGRIVTCSWIKLL